MRRNRSKGSVIVSGGVNVKDQTMASKKGLYFCGNSKAFQTFLVGKPESAMWEIYFVDSDMGQQYHCCFREEMYIGRYAEKRHEVFLPLPQDPRVSKRHCRIFDVDGRLAIEDMKSTNHTFVNGKRCDGPVWLEAGYVIKIGGSRLKVKTAVKKRV